MIQAINRPSRDSAEAFIHAWSDTRGVRSSDSRAYAVLNDAEQPISGGVIDAFRNYDIRPVPWSDHTRSLQNLPPRLQFSVLRQLGSSPFGRVARNSSTFSFVRLGLIDSWESKFSIA